MNLPCLDPASIHRPVFWQFLNRHGAVLLPQFADTLEQFVGLTNALGADFTAYLGGANSGRRPLDDAGTIFPATGEEHGYAIPLHGEMYYLAHRPRLLFFHCQQPSSAGGETTLCDGVALWDALSDGTRRRFRAGPIEYTRRHGPETWRRLYQTEQPKQVAAICDAHGIRFEYDGTTNSVVTRFACPAMLDTPRGTAFINNFLPFAARELDNPLPLTSVVRFADRPDAPLDAALVREVLDVSERLALPHAWAAGDVIVIDNDTVLHGRRHITDPNRRILLRMAMTRGGPSPRAHPAAAG